MKMLNIGPGFPTRNPQDKPMSIVCTESGLTQRRCDYLLLGRQNGKTAGRHRDGDERRKGRGKRQIRTKFKISKTTPKMA